jgi:hypothetical protein
MNFKNVQLTLLNISTCTDSNGCRPSIRKISNHPSIRTVPKRRCSFTFLSSNIPEQDRNVHTNSNTCRTSSIENWQSFLCIHNSTVYFIFRSNNKAIRNSHSKNLSLLFCCDIKLLPFMPDVILLSLKLRGPVVLLAAPPSFTVL